MLAWLFCPHWQIVVGSRPVVIGFEQTQLFEGNFSKNSPNLHNNSILDLSLGSPTIYVPPVDISLS